MWSNPLPIGWSNCSSLLVKTLTYSQAVNPTQWFPTVDEFLQYRANKLKNPTLINFVASNKTFCTSKLFQHCEGRMNALIV